MVACTAVGFFIQGTPRKKLFTYLILCIFIFFPQIGLKYFFLS